jgi:hypothetical protein
MRYLEGEIQSCYPADGKIATIMQPAARQLAGYMHMRDQSENAGKNQGGAH